MMTEAFDEHLGAPQPLADAVLDQTIEHATQPGCLEEVGGNLGDLALGDLRAEASDRSLGSTEGTTELEGSSVVVGSSDEPKDTLPSKQSNTSNPKIKPTPKPKAPPRYRRGNPMKQVKQNLSETGKMNAKKPMPEAQKRARRKKRKRK